MLLETCQKILYKEPLSNLPKQKCLINTINAFSFTVAQYNKSFNSALLKSHALLPDGISIVFAMRFLFGHKFRKIAGADLFIWEMERMEKLKGKCFFLGSSEDTLLKIFEHAQIDFPNVEVKFYSPPFRSVFNENENKEMIKAVNSFSPDVLFIGMTAPKQETWAADNFDRLKATHVCCIGAVFDFYAGTVRRTPNWMIKYGLEWFYRLIREPKRMWRRYLIGNSKFIWIIIREKIMRGYRNTDDNN